MDQQERTKLVSVCLVTYINTQFFPQDQVPLGLTTFHLYLNNQSLPPIRPSSPTPPQLTPDNLRILNAYAGNTNYWRGCAATAKETKFQFRGRRRPHNHSKRTMAPIELPTGRLDVPSDASTFKSNPPPCLFCQPLQRTPLCPVDIYPGGKQPPRIRLLNKNLSRILVV